MIPQPLQDLIRKLGRLPGFGPRSAQRAALHLLTHKNDLQELVQQMVSVSEALKSCQACGNLSLTDTCEICTSEKRSPNLICVVEDVADLWAIERSGAFRGHYHVLGGLLSALDGIGPQDLRIPNLLSRVEVLGAETEVVLALSASVEGQTTSHYIAQKLRPLGVRVTALAKGLPMGADVDYMDDGTLSLALQGRAQI